MKLAGIDPGKDGAYAVDGIAYPLYINDTNPMPAVEDMKLLGVDFVLIEIVEAFAGKGSPKSWSESFTNWGRLFQCLIDNGIGVETVRASEWKKALGIAGSKLTPKDKKQLSISKAKELFPKANLKRTPKCSTDHDGFAEALLIAEHGRRKGL